MADSTVTQTGVAEMRAAVAALPAQVTAALRDVAVKIGGQVQGDARANLLAHTKAEKTAAAITVAVDEVNKVVTVTSRQAPGDPANNPIWLEHGTIHEPAKPYMLPALKSNEAAYLSESESAANDVAIEALT